MGIRDGCAYDSPGLGYTILEELRKGHWGRCARLSHHPLVSKRIHRRAGETPNRRASSAILPTLDRACSVFLHHIGRSHAAGTGGALLFVTVPPTIQHVARAVVDQRAILRDYGRNIVDGGASGDVHRWGAACRRVVVDWMVRKDFRLNNYGNGAPSLLTSILVSLLSYAVLYS